MSASKNKAIIRRYAAPKLAALLLCLAPAAPGCQKQKRRTPDDALVAVMPSPIQDVDPRFARRNADQKLSQLVFAGLTTVDTPSMEPKPALAEEIEQVEDLVWEVTLRPDARFGDGSPVTAADVVWTFESTMANETGSMFAKGFRERFRRLEILDERRLRIYLQKPVATLESDLVFGIIKRPEEGREGRRDTMELSGAGPYRVTSFSSARVLLERNPHYYGERPKMDKLEFVVVRDTNARALMLVGGAADFTQNSIRLDLVDHLADWDRVQAVTGHSAILTYMMMHNEDPLLSDVRVRRAIAHAIDRERIIEAKFSGRAIPATGLLPPMHWAYEGDVARYDYDPERAKRLLDEAGYPDPDGPGGEPRLRLTYKTSADQFRLSMARIIAAQLGEVGIEAQILSFEMGTFFSDIKRGNYQIATMQTAAITEPDWYFPYFHSSRIPTPEKPQQHNRWRYRNERVDELTEAGRQEMDRDRRRVLYREVQEILARELPVVPLWHEDNVAIMNQGVVGYEVLPNARFTFLAGVEKK